MKNVDVLIQRVKKTEHGFLDIQKDADEFKKDNSIQDCWLISQELFSSEIHQARMLGVFILGLIASELREAFIFLRDKVSQDDDWRVQEVLAKAFDKYCSDIGYEKALPEIKKWLVDQNPNVRRAVSEGLRIWTSRDYFRENPEIAIKLLCGLKADDSEYVRKSVGNALRDISKKYKNLIKSELEEWDISDKKIMQTYKLANRFIK
jgi:3-methyladenine DNA glycosylase AlkC